MLDPTTESLKCQPSIPSIYSEEVRFTQKIQVPTTQLTVGITQILVELIQVVHAI